MNRKQMRERNRDTAKKAGAGRCASCAQKFQAPAQLTLGGAAGHIVVDIHLAANPERNPGQWYLGMEPLTETSAFLRRMKAEGIIISKHDFFRWLRARGYLRKNAPGTLNHVSQKASAMGILRIGNQTAACPGRRLYLTPAGCIYFADRLKKEAASA